MLFYLGFANRHRLFLGTIDFDTHLLSTSPLHKADRPKRQYTPAFVAGESHPHLAESELTHDDSVDHDDIGSTCDNTAIGVEDAGATWVVAKADGGNVPRVAGPTRASTALIAMFQNLDGENLGQQSATIKLYLSRAASCQAFCTGDNRYDITVRRP